jgi:pantoate--beta-alanine ligase
MVKPHIAIFGKKDFQQLVTIKRMVADLNIDLEIVGMPTTREKDGLAMSSRNVYLSSEERESALCLSRSLQRAKKQYEEGERDAVRILDSVKKYIENVPFARIDYLKICSTETMQDVKNLDKESVLALAVYIGLTRLIDNYVFGEDLNLN